MNAIAQIARYGWNGFSVVKQQKDANHAWVNQMMLAQRRGRNVLPYFLGLKPIDLHWMTEKKHFHMSSALFRFESEQQISQEDVRQQLLDMRHDEWCELVDLMVSHRADIDDSEILIARIVAAGCLGGSHLWKDLGLASRTELSDMLMLNFPGLAAANDKNMKWKKFFYKQLCEQEGGYVCRAPSCDVCSAYVDCFGPEH